MANKAKGKGKGGGEKQRGRSKIGYVILLFGIVLVLGVATILCGFASRDHDTGVWFKNSNLATWTLKNLETQYDDEIQLTSYSIPVDDYADYGIEPQTIEAGILTAEYTPSNTSNKRTNWTWRFESNEWSKDKILSDYVKFTPGANYAPECRYEILQPFGASILVDCSSRANSALKDTTRIEYCARYDEVDNIYLDTYGMDINFFDALIINDDTYTVKPTSYSANIYICFDSAYAALLEELNGYPADSFEINYEGITEALDWYDIENYFGENPSVGQIAASCIENKTYCWFYIMLDITFYYEGEEIYSSSEFNDINVYFTESCIQQMQVPATNVTSKPDIIVI